MAHVIEDSIHPCNGPRVPIMASRYTCILHFHAITVNNTLALPLFSTLSSAVLDASR